MNRQPESGAELAFQALSLEYSALRQELAGRVGKATTHLALVVSGVAVVAGLGDKVATEARPLVYAGAVLAALLLLIAIGRGLMWEQRLSRYLAAVEEKINALVREQEGHDPGLCWEQTANQSYPGILRGSHQETQLKSRGPSR